PSPLHEQPPARPPRGLLHRSGEDEDELVAHPVLIPAELQPLIEPDQLAGLDITWLPTGTPTPRGDYVAIVPLLSRWVGGTELKHLPKLKTIANFAGGHA